MEEKRNIENFNREILAKYLNNEVCSREKLEVESWLNQSEKNREEMKQSRQMLEKVDVYYKTKSFNSNAAWNNVHSKIYPPQLTVIQHKKVRKETIAQFYKYLPLFQRLPPFLFLQLHLWLAFPMFYIWRNLFLKL